MSDPIELLERRVRAVLDDEKTTAGLHIFCQIGARYDEQGIITLQISGSGWALVSWRIDDETDMYSYQLTDDDMRRVYGLLDQYPFWRASPKRRKRDGDETNVHIRISDQVKGTSNSMQFWSDDMDDFPVLRDLMIRITQLVTALSDGEIEVHDFAE